MPKEESHLGKYILLAVIALLVILSYFIVLPYLTYLISAFVFAYLIRPVHKRLSKKIGNCLSAFISILLIFAIIIIPILFVINNIVQQVQAYSSSGALQTALNYISSNPILAKIDLAPIIEKVLSFLASGLASFAVQIPLIALGIAVTIIGTYYILTGWDALSSALEKYIPFKNKKQVKKEIADTTNNIIHGYFIIAAIDFIIVSLGFYLSGVSYYFFFALLIAILAFLPGLGPGLVWVPVLVYCLFIGNYYAAIGVLITGLIISILIETILSNKILGAKTKIHPLIIWVGILGGVPLFGVFGFIIGPLILSYTIKLIQESIKQNPF